MQQNQNKEYWVNVYNNRGCVSYGDRHNDLRFAQMIGHRQPTGWKPIYRIHVKMKEVKPIKKPRWDISYSEKFDWMG